MAGGIFLPLTDAQDVYTIYRPRGRGAVSVTGTPPTPPPAAALYANSSTNMQTIK